MKDPNIGARQHEKLDGIGCWRDGSTVPATRRPKQNLECVGVMRGKGKKPCRGTKYLDMSRGQATHHGSYAAALGNPHWKAGVKQAKEQATAPTTPAENIRLSGGG